MTLVYCPDIQGDLAVADPEESRHVLQVLRMRAGEAVMVTDGRGSGWRAAICSTNPKGMHLTLEEALPSRPGWGFHLHIGLAPTKQAARLEWFLEKAAEMGVDRISLLGCARGERAHWRHDRLQRILVAAMKQSGQFTLPRLDEGETPLARLLEEYGAMEANKVMATCDWGNIRPLSAVYQPEKTHSLALIGPEGDFTPQEVALARESGFIPVLLGPNRLRTETAGVVVCAQMHILHEAR